MSGTSRFRGDHIRVLIVDDEPALTELLCVAVTEAGRRPCPALDGESALRIARSSAPHAVVLDGLQVLRRLRYERPRLPVLMLTARDALEHRLDGLEAGAGDYVTKPFPWRRSCCGCADCCAGAAPNRPASPDCAAISTKGGPR